MILTLKKIEHKGADRIGIFFPYSFEVNQKMKSLGAVYSSTLRCWYLDYNKGNYNLLLKNLENLHIEKINSTIEPAIPVAGPVSRDLPPIASNGKEETPPPIETKFPEKAPERADKGHKAELVPLAQKLRVKLFENIGKYWVFAMVRYSKPHKCFLLPATQEVFDGLVMHYEPDPIFFDNQLPETYRKPETPFAFNDSLWSRVKSWRSR